MERRKEKIEEQSEAIEKPSQEELEALKKELLRLRELKKQKELKEKEQVQEIKSANEQEKPIDKEESVLDDIEKRLNEIDKYLVNSFEEIDKTNYEEHAEYIETQFQTLEEEIIGEKGLIAKEISSYEKLINAYSWLEEPKYEFMYSIPNKKKNPSDFESWKTEWAKVLFDYARFAILHILYIRQLYSEKPFSKFEDRQKAIEEIAEELIAQNLGQYLSKKKEKLRIYWKTLDLWAEDIYDWAIEDGKLDPILIFEIRESNKEFSNLPKLDLEEIFKILSKDNRGNIIKTNDGQISFKIRLE